MNTKTLNQIWKLENIALKQDYFSLEFASKELNLTKRRTFDLLNQIKRWNILKQYNLPGKRGRPRKLFRLSLKELKEDKSRLIFDYVGKIRDKAEAIVLFGSYLTDYFDETSDIDLLVQTNKKLLSPPEEIEVLKIKSFKDVPLLTKYNLLNKGVIILTDKKLPALSIDFEKAIRERKDKIEEDLKLLKIMEFPESAGFLCQIAMNMGYILKLRENKIPSCWKETKEYIKKILPEIDLLYPYYLKYLKERKISELNLNKKKYSEIKNKVRLIWQQIQKNSYPKHYLQQAM